MFVSSGLQELRINRQADNKWSWRQFTARLTDAVSWWRRNRKCGRELHELNFFLFQFSIWLREVFIYFIDAHRPDVWSRERRKVTKYTHTSLWGTVLPFISILCHFILLLYISGAGMVLSTVLHLFNSYNYLYLNTDT